MRERAVEVSHADGSQSTDESLVRVYKHACKLGPDSKIAIIDLWKANGQEKYSRCNAVGSLNLKRFTKENYGGKGEWLIWGGTDAILGTASVQQLEALRPIEGYEDPFLVSHILYPALFNSDSNANIAVTTVQHYPSKQEHFKRPDGDFPVSYPMLFPNRQSSVLSSPRFVSSSNHPTLYDTF